MRLDEFRRVIRRDIEAWQITDRFTLYRKNYTLWDNELDVEYPHKKLDDALDFEIDGVKLSTWIENLPDDHFRKVVFNGGSGSSSKNRINVKGQESATVEITPLLPAIRNNATANAVGNGGKYRTFEDAVRDFDKAHRNSPIEYGTTVTTSGFTTTYQSGDSMSVGFQRITKGEHVLHNHPTRKDGTAGGNLSTTDLRTFTTRGLASVTAIDRDGVYTVKRGAKFDAKGFDQALQRLEKRGLSTTGINADTAIDMYSKSMSRWLRVNAKRYGYTHSFTPHQVKKAIKPKKPIPTANQMQLL